MAVAKLVTESKLFYRISKEDRDAFLSALPFAKTIWKRVQSFIAIFRNKFFFDGGLGQEGSSKQIQRKLLGMAEEALFQALNEAKSPEDVRKMFVASFQANAKDVPGWKRFSSAFQEELTEKASTYTAWWKRLHPLTTEQGKALTHLLEQQTPQEFVFRNKEGAYYTASRSEDRKSVQIHRYGEEDQDVLDLRLEGGQATVRSSDGAFLSELSAQQAELLDVATATAEAIANPLSLMLPNVGLKEEELLSLSESLRNEDREEAPEGLVSQKKYAVWFQSPDSGYGSAIVIQEAGEFDGQTLSGKLEVDISPNGSVLSIFVDSIPVPVAEFSEEHQELLKAIYSKISGKAPDSPQKKRAKPEALLDLPNGQATEAVPQETAPDGPERAAAAAIARKRHESSPEERTLQEKQKQGVQLFGKIQTFIANLKKEDFSSLMFRATFALSGENEKRLIIEDLHAIQDTMVAAVTKTALRNTIAHALKMLSNNVKKQLKSALTAEKFKEISDLITEAEHFQAGLV